MKTESLTNNILISKAVVKNGKCKIYTLLKLLDVSGNTSYSLMVTSVEKDVCNNVFVNDFSRNKEFALKVFWHIVDGNISSDRITDTIESFIE